MWISISFSHLTQHLDILNQELTVARLLVEKLTQLYNQEMNDPSGLNSVDIYRRQIRAMDAQIKRIEQRLHVLQEAKTIFVDANQKMESRMAEIDSLINKHL